ncbi:MAG TPA: hypothetical protein VG796_17800 [Verrucomicrobiales bacterium]|nr:hypothetical protein [Verrucomicrobiales bacterium]
MVEVRYRGGFGDNLFQYCFGRLLAERWGCELVALPLPRFPNTAEPVRGRRFLSPFQSWSGMAVEERQLGMLLRDREMAAPARARTVLYGWFQRWEYYRDHGGKIRRWLVTDPPPEPAQEDDIAVCLRSRRPESWEEPGIHSGAPPLWKKRTIPLQGKVLQLLERIPHRRLLILSDDMHGEAVESMRHLNPTVLHIDSFASWNWLRTFSRIVLPICHPSDWWAAWLSNAKEIYAVDPWPSHKRIDCTGPYGCGWTRGRPLARPNLRVNEPRWIYDW